MTVVHSPNNKQHVCVLTLAALGHDLVEDRYCSDEVLIIDGLDHFVHVQLKHGTVAKYAGSLLNPKLELPEVPAPMRSPIRVMPWPIGANWLPLLQACSAAECGPEA